MGLSINLSQDGDLGRDEPMDLDGPCMDHLAHGEMKTAQI